MHRVLVSVVAVTFFMCVFLAQATAADIKNGARIYKQYCISCHGSEGQGDGDRAKNEQLDPRHRVHANGDYMNMIPSMRFFSSDKIWWRIHWFFTYHASMAAYTF